jgi:hypothetical protein
MNVEGSSQHVTKARVEAVNTTLRLIVRRQQGDCGPIPRACTNPLVARTNPSLKETSGSTEEP